MTHSIQHAAMLQSYTRQYVHTHMHFTFSVSKQQYSTVRNTVKNDCIFNLYAVKMSSSELDLCIRTITLTTVLTSQVKSSSCFKELFFTVISVLINAVDSSNTAVMRVSAVKVS